MFLAAIYGAGRGMSGTRGTAVAGAVVVEACAAGAAATSGSVRTVLSFAAVASKTEGNSGEAARDRAVSMMVEGMDEGGGD